TLNGSAILTNGLVANATTTDFTGRLAFNSGSLGLTTIAVAGYDSGSLYSRAQALQAVEENETSIKKDDRYFTPMSVVTEVTGLIDTNNNDTNLYVDFSARDPSVKAQLGIGTTEDVNFAYDGAGRLTVTLGTSGLSASFNINPESLYNGLYISDTDLKGLYIKSTTTVDVDGSTTAVGATSDDVDVTQGDVLTEVMTYATNPRSSTTETLSNFVGGMQFQLGNSSGDQDRTVYSVQSMDTANLGQVTVDGTLYSLQDIQGGSVADLSRDPILAMKIIEQAVDDVTNLRARLGAFQSNMLQTNIISLEVAVENITLTESAIRDSDMAAETTDFTKYQIMSQASTSMLAQANQLSQNVLTLLQ
ncbi:MAG: hypothetical protein LIQ31_14740, partial [Planctomycetes bacterium]|nr:hypothetical protein [Planctomycetota bacterium]